MLSKNAMNNMKNRYSAVLKKCRLLNVFGSLAIVTSLLCAPAFAGTPAVTVTTGEYDEAYDSSYYTTYGVPVYDVDTDTYSTATYGVLIGLDGVGTDGGMSYYKDIDDLLVDAITNTTSVVSDTESTYFKNISQVTDTGNLSQGTDYTFKIDYEGTTYYFAVNNDSGVMSSVGSQQSDPTSDVNANFIGIDSSTDGGAIDKSDESTEISISCSFIGNHASSSNAVTGGAICNYGGQKPTTISSITGSFIGNYVSSTSNIAQGGAIYNSEDATINSISGFFIGNYASGTTSAYGGAIANTHGTIGLISGSFIGNYASGTTSAYGGAIYNTVDTNTYPNGGKLTFLAKNETHIFTDNYTTTDGGNTKTYNFITSDWGSLTFTMQGTGGFILNDSIVKGSESDKSLYTLSITGEDKDKNIFSLNDVISGFSTFDVSNATLSLGSYEHENGSTTVGNFCNDSSSTMSFTNANLSIDTLAFDGITDSTAVLDGLNITLTATGSTLILANASAENTYTIAENFKSVSGLFTEATTIVANSLLEVTSVSGDAGDSAYTVTVGVKSTSPDTGTIDTIYNTPSADFLYAVASSGSELYSSTSTNAGARFIYNAMELSISDEQKIQIVEGAVQMGAVAGVQKETATVIGTSNTLLDTRMLNANTINPSGIAMRIVDEDGEVLVYNNITELADNSGDVVSDVVSDAVSDAGAGVLASPKDYTELWLMPMYSHQKVSGVSSGNFSDTGYSSDMYGVALGLDRTFQDTYRVGLAFNMGTGSSESSGDYANTENDYDFFGLTAYGALRFDNLSLLGSIGYTKNDSEVAQDLRAYGLNNLYADIDSDVWNFAVKAEYTFALDHGFKLAPYAGVQYMIMTTDDYNIKESNSIGNGAHGNTVFNVDSDRQEVVSFPLGLSFSKEYNTASGWDFTPKANAGVIFATGDLHATSVTSVPDIDESSRMSLKVIDDTTLDLGLGLTASKDNMALMLDYDFQYSEHRTAHGLTAKVEWKF